MFVTEQRNLEITATDKIAIIIFRLERGFKGSWIITLWIFRNVISQLNLRTLHACLHGEVPALRGTFVFYKNCHLHVIGAIELLK